MPHCIGGHWRLTSPGSSGKELPDGSSGHMPPSADHQNSALPVRLKSGRRTALGPFPGNERPGVPL